MAPTRTAALPIAPSHPRRASVATRSGYLLLFQCNGSMSGVRIDAPFSLLHPPSPAAAETAAFPLLHPPNPAAAKTAAFPLAISECRGA